MFRLHRCQDLQLLCDKVRRIRPWRELQCKHTSNRIDRTYRIRRILKMVSPPLTSFSSFVFRFRSMIVPRFLCEYTLLARFLIEGDALCVCCIIRTHTSMSMSLVNPTPISQNPTYIARHRRTCSSHSTTELRRYHGIFDSVGSREEAPLHRRRSSLVRTRTKSHQLFFTCFKKDDYLEPLEDDIYLLVRQRPHIAWCL